MLATAVLASAEKMINGALYYDPATRIGLARLTGKTLAINSTSPEFEVFVMPTDQDVRLMGHWEGSVDTHLKGSLMALVQLTRIEIHNLKDSGVSVSGDINMLAELQQLLGNLDIDWEELLSQLTGDVVGHQSARFIREQFAWIKTRANNAQRLTQEFLTEELKALPSTIELEQFYQQVDDLRLAVDRASARVEKIIKGKNNP